MTPAYLGLQVEHIDYLEHVMLERIVCSEWRGVNSVTGVFMVAFAEAVNSQAAWAVIERGFDDTCTCDFKGWMRIVVHTEDCAYSAQMMSFGDDQYVALSDEYSWPELDL